MTQPEARYNDDGTVAAGHREPSLERAFLGTLSRHKTPIRHRPRYAAAGQPRAAIGDTGNVDAPQLHVELWDGMPVDPVVLLDAAPTQPIFP
jgi:hypothetical protein